MNGTSKGITRATIELGPEESNNLLARSFQVHWAPQTPAGTPVQLDATEIAAITAFRAAVRDGSVSFSLIRKAAPILGRLLGNAPRNPSGIIEIVGSGSTDALTGVQWEAAALGTSALPQDDGDLLQALFGSLPLYRLIPGDVDPSGDAKHRPRVLLLISNPVGINGGRIEVSKVQRAFEAVLSRYPVFQSMVCAEEKPWGELATKIAMFDPHIFLFVGHGSSSPEYGNPVLAFADRDDPTHVRRVPIRDVAKQVTAGRSCCLAVLAACDFVYQSPTSGAVELIESGIDDVVAMQGSIEQGVATTVLSHMLANAFVGNDVPSGLALARTEVRTNPHCILPVAFRSSGKGLRRLGLRNYGAVYAETLRKLSRVFPEQEDLFVRPELIKQIEKLFRGKSSSEAVSVIHGGTGDGLSIALRAVIASVLEDAHERPIFYIDCEPQRRTLSLPDWVCAQMVWAADLHPVLIPTSASSFAPSFRDTNETAEWAGHWAVHAGVSVVLDNLRGDISQEEKNFLRHFAEMFYKKGRQAHLVLGGGRELLTLVTPYTSVAVLPLSKLETEQFGQQFLSHVPPAELYESTKGSLLLLDAERRSPIADAPAISQTAQVIDIFMARLDRILSEPARAAAIRLAFFPAPLQEELAQSLLMPEFPQAFAELQRAGILEIREEGDSRSFYVSRQRGADIKRHWAAEREANHVAIVERLLKLFDSESDTELDRIAGLHGASTYFTIAQQLTAETDQSFTAFVMPKLLKGRLEPHRELALYKRSAQMLDDHQTDPIPDVDEAIEAEVLIAGASIALDLGDSQLAQRWLNRFSSPSIPVLRYQRILLEIKIHKDQQQAGGTSQILAAIAQASQLVNDATTDEDRSEIESLRTDLCMAELPTVLFFTSEPLEDVWKRVEPLLPELPAADRAVILSTVAERAMKAPRDQVNWTEVAAWVAESRGLSDTTEDYRAQTYCLYQQAQYFRKKLKPSLSDAYDIYERARSAGASAREYRREALALSRLLELELNESSLRGDEDTWQQKRLSEVNDLAKKLVGEEDNALSMRALGRLLAAGAEIASVTETRQALWEGAARAFSGDVLSSVTDNEKFAAICLARITSDLGQTAGHQYAMRFLNSFCKQIERRFGIVVDVDSPAEILTAIAEWRKTMTKQIDPRETGT